MIVASILLILVAVALLVAGLAGGSSPLLITSIAASLLAAVALVAGARQAASARATADRSDRPRDRTAPGGPPPGEPEIPVQHIPSTIGTGVSGWRQPPGSPVTDPSRLPPESSADDPYLAPGPRESFAADVDPPVDAPAPTSPEGDGPIGGVPPAERLTQAETSRLVEIFADVRVVDGHPRFHLPDCPQLVGRDDESLPVAEAVGLGFTPCADCAPASTLLADPPRRRSR
ncbi:hypothetical protein ACL02O_16670 [Micromonospora sp. MS34]|uniref:hypothetical protein n=1 Tax=Micromonospora sp. MS34 TaxID=3385971 RepID=UPI0039A298DA